jgi:hypothetical protein
LIDSVLLGSSGLDSSKLIDSVLLGAAASVLSK